MRTKHLLIGLFFLQIAHLSYSKETVLKGLIPNYRELDSTVYMDKSISVIYFDKLGRDKMVSSLIQNDGTFQLSFDIEKVLDVQIKSGTVSNTWALVIPGDTINMNLRYNICNQKFQGLPSPFYQPDFDNAFVGKYALIQKQFWDFTYNWLIKNEIAQKLYKTSDPLNEKIGQIPAILKPYFDLHKDNPLLYEWGVNYLFYGLLNNLIRNNVTLNYKSIAYPFSELTESSEYSVFLGMMGPKMSQKYGNLILHDVYKAVAKGQFSQIDKEEKMAFNHLFDNSATSKDTVICKKVLKRVVSYIAFKNFSDSIVLAYNKSFYNEVLPDHLSELLLANDIIDRSKNISFISMLHSQDLRDYVANILNEPTSAKINIADFKYSGSAIIKDLLKKYKGQNIYIDIWATWCGPCRSEFQYYPGLIEKYLGKVVFVCLCASSPEETFKTIVNEQTFKVEHYFLSASQYEELQHEFKIVAFPHYILIDKNGNVKNNSFRPSSKDALEGVL
ncbi:MAG: TlpA disulfide reductase family protein [Bacteroidota bacterium]|nr:TlpA disulfide reductase family protein [Bacteroidota bacterium]